MERGITPLKSLLFIPFKVPFLEKVDKLLCLGLEWEIASAIDRCYHSAPLTSQVFVDEGEGSEALGFRKNLRFKSWSLSTLSKSVACSFAGKLLALIKTFDCDVTSWSGALAGQLVCVWA